jgi:hypothetical protein
VNKATRLANKMLEARGYIVAHIPGAHHPQPEVGKQYGDINIDLKGGTVSGPFFVKSETTGADYDEQMRLGGSDWVDFPHGWHQGKGWRFYRLVAE